MHRYHREESFKPKNVPLAPQEVLEQKLVLIIVIENGQRDAIFLDVSKQNEQLLTSQYIRMI